MKVCMAGVQKKESPRELSRKCCYSARFFLFRSGGACCTRVGFIRSAASSSTHIQLSEMPLTKSLKPAKYPPRTSFDGRSPNSKYWGKRYGLVTMCPHMKRKEHGGDDRQCGLQREFCKCLCPRCCTPLRARKQCSNSLCRWGLGGSPDAITPEESPEEPRPRRRPSPEANRGPTVSHPRGSLQVYLHLRDRRTFASNPPPAHMVSPPVTPRPKRVVSPEARPVTWRK
jgi:hypothetical protein